MSDLQDSTPAFTGDRVEWCGNLKVIIPAKGQTPAEPEPGQYIVGPLPEDGPAEQLGQAINRAVREYAVRRAADIEMHCAIALMLGIGVRIRNYDGGGYDIAVDATVPEREIYEEHHPAQPTFGLIFND